MSLSYESLCSRLLMCFGITTNVASRVSCLFYIPKVSRFSRVSNFAMPAEFISASDSCLHARFDLEDRSDRCIQRDVGQDCGSAGNGGCSTKVSFFNCLAVTSANQHRQALAQQEQQEL